ncbi:hypothetical protein ACFRMO_37485, partial [Streptomyces anulatus]|uniref:hypothetical protein n=1 Tax=Streptomyces anulatus TaxID=1892 RepID=UPI0036B9846E
LLRRGADRQESLACLLDRDAESVASVCDHLTELGLVRAGTGGALHPVSPVKAVESLVMSELVRRRGSAVIHPGTTSPTVIHPEQRPVESACPACPPPAVPC